MATISFGQWLKQRRKALDLTQAQLAQRVGCSMEAIRKIEAEHRRPSKAIAARLAICLGIPAAAHEEFANRARSGLEPRQALLTRDVADTSTPLDWSHIIAGLEALRRGDFGLYLPTQPPGTQAAGVVHAYNALVMQLVTITAELTRVIREVGYDSRLGCQADVPYLEGRWSDLQVDLNQMAEILTLQIRQIAQTTTALATGAPAVRLVADARGEMRGVQAAINQLVERTEL